MVIDLSHERRKEEAVQWFGRMHLAEPSAEDIEYFKRWYQAHPANAETYDQARDVWQDIGQLGQLPNSKELLHDIALLAKQPPQPRRRHLAWAATVLLVIGATIFAYRSVNPGVRYQTEIAELRNLTLTDGSKLTLGARSSIRLEYDRKERHIHLIEGEAYFDVAKDPARPFIVTAGDNTVLALGTQFEVRREQDTLRVAVVEGTVSVTSAHLPALLNAGQQVTTRLNGGSPPLRIVKTKEPAAWRTGRLSYDGARLSEVIADLNRYYPAGVTLSSPDLARLTVTTAFNVDQIDPLINSLTLALALDARHDPNGHIVLTASKK